MEFEVITESARPAMDTAKREALIMEHLPQVRFIARRLLTRVGGSTQIEDLVSAGILGLIAAVDSYDSARHVQLKTYADHRIRGAMLDSLRSADFAPRTVRRKAKTIEQAIQSLQGRLGRSPGEEEIAQELSLGLEEYRSWLVDVQHVRLECLDAPEYKEDRSTKGDRLSGAEEHSPDSIYARKEIGHLLSAAINALPTQEQQILSMYFQHEVSPSEIAKIMQLRRARVSQLKAQGLLRLRGVLKNALASR